MNALMLLSSLLGVPCLFWPGPCRNTLGIFAVYILEDSAGDFPGGFFWALVPHSMRR